MNLIALHFAQKLNRLFRFRNKSGLTQVLLNLLALLGFVTFMHAPCQILHIGDSNNVIEVLFNHWDASKTRTQGKREPLAQRLIALHPNHIGARNH